MSDPVLAVTLPEWEGPLDLLLHVIRTHKLDILDIPIAFVTEQYLAYLEELRNLDLDIAAEYLEMAATLVYIKSRSMLPSPPREEEVEEDEEDPRQELIRRLLEYQRYKEAARELAERPRLGRDTFAPAPREIDEGEEEQGGLVELGLFELAEAFRRILSRTKLASVHHVTVERMTISERIGELVERLEPGRLVPFEELFVGRRHRYGVVLTLLALLEMARLRMVRLWQASLEGELYVSLSGSQPIERESVSVSGDVGARPWETGLGGSHRSRARLQSGRDLRPEVGRRPGRRRPSRRRPSRVRPNTSRLLGRTVRGRPRR